MRDFVEESLGSAPYIGKDGRPIVLDADYGPTFVACSFERLLGAGRVVELTLGVVVEQGEPVDLEVAQQLDHWQVAAVAEAATDRLPLHRSRRPLEQRLMPLCVVHPQCVQAGWVRTQFVYDLSCVRWQLIWLW